MPPLLVRFCGRADNAGGPEPQWRITSSSSVKGEGLASAETLSVVESSVADSETQSLAGTVWAIRGTTSNTRYTTKEELAELVAKQEGLGRAKATNAALIFIKKSESWWSLPQDERRAIIEKDGHIGHGAFALDYLPAVSRRLHHSRELGEQFDFVTWFEYAPDDAPAFDELVRKLRQTAEWGYVEREVDIRLVRFAP